MNEPRVNYFQYLGQEIELLTKLEKLVDQSSLCPKLIELIKLRLSQINGCSFCVSYHTQRLRLMKETTERIDMVAVWREAPCFSAQEKQAIAWAEAVTRLADSSGIDDELYAATLDALGEEGISQLTMAVGMINVWNRLGVSFQPDHSFVAELLNGPLPAQA